MRLSRIAFLILFLLLLISCISQKENISDIVKVEVETQMADMVEKTIAASPTETTAPTQIIRPPQYEAREQRADIPMNFVLEVGYCPIDIDTNFVTWEIEENPINNPNCIVVLRREEFIDEGGVVEYNPAPGDYSNFQIFCTSYYLDGTFIKADFNKKGDGVAVCMPYEGQPLKE